MTVKRTYRDSDVENDDALRGRAKRFVEECDRFEKQFGFPIDDELEGLITKKKLALIKSGDVDVVAGLRPRDLWSVMISLNINLRYVLWGSVSQ